MLVPVAPTGDGCENTALQIRDSKLAAVRGDHPLAISAMGAGAARRQEDVPVGENVGYSVDQAVQAFEARQAYLRTGS